MHDALGEIEQEIARDTIRWMAEALQLQESEYGRTLTETEREFLARVQSEQLGAVRELSHAPRATVSVRLPNDEFGPRVSDPINADLYMTVRSQGAGASSFTQLAVGWTAEATAVWRWR